MAEKEEFTFKTLLTQRLSLALFVFNTIGAVIYGVAASPSWRYHRSTGSFLLQESRRLVCRCLPNRCRVPLVESRMGSTYLRLPTVERQSLMAIENPTLARCGVGRFRAPLISEVALRIAGSLGVRLPSPNSYFKRKTLFDPAHGQSPGWQAHLQVEG